MKHILSLGIVLLASTALGQTSVERFERQLEMIQRQQRVLVNPEVPAGQRALIDYGGYISANFFAIDDQQARTHILREYDLVGYARVNVNNVHEFFFRGRMGYQDWNAGDSFDGEGDETIWPRVEQAYYRFDLARYLSAYKGQKIENNLVVTAGRQFVYWANGLVLADNLDGLLMDFTVGKVTLEILGGITDHKTVDFDSSRPQFDDRTERGFYGAMLSAQLGKHRPYVYGLIQRDYNSDGPYTIGTIPTRFEYNSWYIGAGSAGSIGDRIVYGAEIVYEGGNGLSNSFDPTTLAPIPQQHDEISAGAADLRFDYLFNDARHSRLSLEGILATGDPDRLSSSNTFGGNAPGGQDTAFNAFGLVNTGLAFAPSVSNLAVLRVGGSTFPFPSGVVRRLQVGMDWLVFAKFRENAPIDETTNDGHFLGWEPDVYLNWQITSDITFALRYGVFFPSGTIVSDEHPRNFFFAGITFSF